MQSTSESVQGYLQEWRELLAADEARHAGVEPQFLIKPLPHVARRVEASRLLKPGVDEELLELLDAAEEDALWIEGFVDGRPFEGWRDMDDLLGTTLEVFAGGRFIWIPFEHIRKLRLEKSESLRDELYRPATVWLVDENEYEVFVPALYVGTHEHPEEGIRVGAGNDWQEQYELIRGKGEKTFMFGEEELGLGEFKQVELRS